ncbi:MAG: hypothetical protein GX275_02090 [Clostridiales bacterium]|nr:hypothetical protein [Clostridiales bacterium]
MYKRKMFISFILLLVVLLTIIGIVKINIINSQFLSPITVFNDGNTLEENELSKEYNEFIKDESFIKIYKEDSGEYLVKVGNNDFKISTESSIIKGIKNIFNKIQEFIARL